MRYRPFGATGVRVSEVGFGAWGIGGAYGPVSRSDALDALACAEDLGCNFVDSALVYGDAEVRLGEFLATRRDRWFVATKYSGQPEGMRATLEHQLRCLRTEHVDFYQVHWYPRGEQASLFDELDALKREGKLRFAGVSLYSPMDIRDAGRQPGLDGFQVEHSVLEPNVLMTAMPWVNRRQAVVVRSALGGGLLSGRYGTGVTFTDAGDQRSEWGRARIDRALGAVDALRNMTRDVRTTAIRYPLSVDVVSTVIVGTKSREQAQKNFGATGEPLTKDELARIARIQRKCELRHTLLRTALQRWRLRLR